MSKLDTILQEAAHAISKGVVFGDFEQQNTKQEIKDLVLETYNGALQLWIDKKAENLDEAFEQKVEEL